jgi:hypothetical protein
MVGNDYQRIIDGVNYWKKLNSIDAIYLLYDNKQDKYGFASQKNAHELRTTLSFLRSQPTITGYNPQSYQDVFCKLYAILNREIELYHRHVLIDSTSTTKEAYGATVTISLMFKKVRIYIVPPEERGWYVPSPNDEVFYEWFDKTRNVKGMDPQEIYLPGQRLKRPNKEETLILLKLNEHNGHTDMISSLIRWCSYDPQNPVIKNRFSRIIKRLETKGFVEKTNSKKGKRVHLTQFGKVYAEAVK